MSVAILEYRDVTVRYERNRPPTIVGVSFAIQPGERVALLGLNGSGKTTLLASAAGLVSHDGDILFDGLFVTAKTLSYVRSRTGYLFSVPENQLLFPGVLDDVAFGMTKRGCSSKEARVRALQILETLGVARLAESDVYELSRGEKQRVALAGVLVLSPSLLILDEPSASLDPPGRRALASTLRSQKTAMVIATHDIAFADSLCTRFLTLSGGRIVYDGSDSLEATRFWET